MTLVQPSRSTQGRQSGSHVSNLLVRGRLSKAMRDRHITCDNFLRPWRIRQFSCGISSAHQVGTVSPHDEGCKRKFNKHPFLCLVLLPVEQAGCIEDSLNWSRNKGKDDCRNDPTGAFSQQFYVAGEAWPKTESRWRPLTGCAATMLGFSYLQY
jgi:hypothetical protein